MKEDYEENFVSSSNQFEEFLSSTVWTDIKGELNIWLEGVRDGLEDTDSDEKDLFRNQGRAEAVRYLLSLPETIRDTILEDQHRESQKEQNKEEGEI
uniref:Uncharacterized protein n=1 Tax=viral metagenome TaxID=1070528 RepID=A0A6H1ZGX1_9ZZZZ